MKCTPKVDSPFFFYAKGLSISTSLFFDKIHNIDFLFFLQYEKNFRTANINITSSNNNTAPTIAQTIPMFISCLGAYSILISDISFVSVDSKLFASVVSAKYPP